MTEAKQIAARYIETWNAVDDGHRRQLLEQHWTDDASYVDPLMSASGSTEMAGIIGAVRDRFPGFRFTLLGTPDGHGRWVRFSWGLGPDGVPPVIEGSDVVEIENQRVKHVIGFLDKVPTAA